MRDWQSIIEAVIIFKTQIEILYILKVSIEITLQKNIRKFRKLKTVKDRRRQSD